MKIKVEKKHIQNGWVNNCYDCPIAKSLKDAFPEAKRVFIQATFGQITFPDKTPVRFDLPVNAQEFIAAYDSNSKPVQPFEFELTL